MKFKEFSFVCYAVSDVKRARDFYENVLGLVPGNVWEGETSAFIEYAVGPDTLAIGMGSEHFKPGKNGATVALETGDFDNIVSEFTAKNVKIIMNAEEFPSCKMMIVEDPDGNQIMIHGRKM